MLIIWNLQKGTKNAFKNKFLIVYNSYIPTLVLCVKKKIKCYESSEIKKTANICFQKTVNIFLRNRYLSLLHYTYYILYQSLFCKTYKKVYYSDSSYKSLDKAFIWFSFQYFYWKKYIAVNPFPIFCHSIIR